MTRSEGHDRRRSVAVQQAVYRQLLQATAYPGQVADLATAGGGALGWHALLHALCDETVSLCDHDRLLDERSLGLLGARRATASAADFVLLRAVLAPPADFTPRLGELESPELGATLILIGETVGVGSLRLSLTGPGVNGEALLKLGGVDRQWFDRRADWVAGFPLGVDVFVCDNRHVAALPRTTRVNLET